MRKKKTYERVDGLRSLVYLGLARNIKHAMDHYSLIEIFNYGSLGHILILFPFHDIFPF